MTTHWLNPNLIRMGFLPFTLNHRLMSVIFLLHRLDVIHLSYAKKLDQAELKPEWTLW